MANDLDDLDEAEGGPQPAESRELVIVDLGHATIMPPSSLEHRAAALAGATRDSIHAMTPESPSPASRGHGWGSN